MFSGARVRDARSRLPILIAISKMKGLNRMRNLHVSDCVSAKFNSVRLVGVLIALFLCCTTAVFAQTLAGVSGTVTDPSGAKVVGAIVTALNTGTGVSTTAPTNSAGIYTMPSLPPGNYNFTAEQPGFRKAVIHSSNSSFVFGSG